MNSSAAASKLHSSSGIIGELGEFASAAWFAQNSSAKPLDASSNPACALVTPASVFRRSRSTPSRAPARSQTHTLRL